MMGYSDYNGPEIMFPSFVLTPHIPKDLEKGFVMRPLERMDLTVKGYLDLLRQLTDVGRPTEREINARFEVMANTRPQSYFVVVIEDKETAQIIASATLVIEFKFIHDAGLRGRVEDVVVDRRYRRQKFGGALNYALKELASCLGVYKLSLECKTELIPFYQKYGYEKDEGNNFLVQRFD